MGVDYIELRQGTLLGYEDDGHIPNVTAIVELVNMFPEVQFNYAFSLPFMSNVSSWEDEIVQKAILLTQELGRQNFVRVVDVFTNNANFDPSKASSIVQALSSVSGKLAKQNLRLVVENAAVEWNSFWGILSNCIMGTLVIFICGVSWLATIIGFRDAITFGVIPFIIPGAIKAFLLSFAIATSISTDQLPDNYRNSLLTTTIVLGAIHLTVEIRQFIWKPLKYITDFWNYFGLCYFIIIILVFVINF